MATLIRTPVPHITVEIRDTAKPGVGRSVIEVLSPTNKKGKGTGIIATSREQVLRSTAHLIEIDLLRKGRRVPMYGKLPSLPYFRLRLPSRVSVGDRRVADRLEPPPARGPRAIARRRR